MNPFADSMAGAAALIASSDARLLGIVGLSLAVSGVATLLGGSVGLVLGAGLAVFRFRGRQVVLTLLSTLLALPSVVVGLLVYLLLSRAGPLGHWGLLFTPQAMVLAQAILILPMVTALSRQTIEDAMVHHGEQLRSLGANRATCGWLLLWDERMALLVLCLAAFGRAISEVGAVMIVGGNIDGVTRVMTTSIALETSKGDLPLALALGAVLLTVVLALNTGVSMLRGWLARPSEVVA